MNLPDESPPVTASSERVPCPGCGGRNDPTALECDWCGRPFVSPSQRSVISAWALLATILVVMVVLAVGAFMFVSRPSAGGGGTQSGGAASPTVAAVRPSPTGGEPTRPPAITSIQEPPSTAATRLASPPPTAVTARVVRTSGQGVTVRQEPGPAGRSVATLREGALVTLTGAQQSLDGTPWMEVELEPGRVGWVSAEFLEPESL